MEMSFYRFGTVVALYILHDLLISMSRAPYATKPEDLEQGKIADFARSNKPSLRVLGVWLGTWEEGHDKTGALDQWASCVLLM